MKKQILDRIKALGGNIENVKDQSLVEDLQSITFNSVLYERPYDTPWSTAEQQEPIHGLAEYIDAHLGEFEADPDHFYHQLITEYYQLTEEPRGQTFWQPLLFTPYKDGTDDFEEWPDR